MLASKRSHSGGRITTVARNCKGATLARMRSRARCSKNLPLHLLTQRARGRAHTAHIYADAACYQYYWQYTGTKARRLVRTHHANCRTAADWLQKRSACQAHTLTFTRAAHKATYPRVGSLEGKRRAKFHRAPTKRNFARMSNSLHHGTPMLRAISVFARRKLQRYSGQ